MIVSKLQGGLGNQLFQYALGRTLALQNNTHLFLDLGGLSQGFTRAFQLHYFNIDAKIATEKETMDLVGKNKISRKIIRIINTFLPYSLKRLVAESHSQMFRYVPGILTITSPAYIEGYWQNEKYFRNIETTLRKELTLKESLPSSLDPVISEISKSYSVSIHIRRGDYLLPHNAPNFITYGDEYLKEALKIVAEKVVTPHFFIFSDDIEWVRKNITLSYPTTYISAHDAAPAHELTLMSMCRHNIIANSSFSWWGAWLNNHKDKIVIAPKKWLNDVNKDTSDLTPPSWIKI